MDGAFEAIRTPNLRLRRATLYPIELRMQNVAGEPGFEPELPGPEPGVLPLNYSPRSGMYLYRF